MRRLFAGYPQVIYELSPEIPLVNGCCLLSKILCIPSTGCQGGPRRPEVALSFADVAAIIDRHNKGEKLNVAGVGEFEIEWHLAADLKTLKALFGCKGGANAKYACLYCLLQWAKGQWKGGACKCAQHKPPERDSAASVKRQRPEKWDPILPIPLERVHLCTMHAENRLLEKLVHLHVAHVWNSSSAGRAKRLQALERVLSEAGVQGGNAKIEWDDTKKRVTKHSFKDTTARRFTSKLDSQGRQVGNLWRKLLEAEDDPDRRRRVQNQKVWEAYERLAPYLRNQKYRVATGSDPTKYKRTVGDFLRVFVDCWRETHVTHHMVDYIPVLRLLASVSVQRMQTALSLFRFNSDDHGQLRPTS